MFLTEAHEMGLPSSDSIWTWQEKLNSFGPRLTGSSAHASSIDFIQQELEALHLKVLRDHLSFNRWQAEKWHLRVLAAEHQWEDMPVSFYFPYSGATGPNGAEGELVYYKSAPWSFSRATGKIAVVDVAVPILPKFLVSLLLQTRSRYPDSSADFADRFTTPLLATARLPDLAAAAKSGVLGVICVWRGCSAANATYQYIPFTLGLQGCPALWVSSDIGDRLRILVEKGARVRLSLEATVSCCQTDTVYCVVPGTDPSETIIVNTHTDGPNACEENGPVALLALAQWWMSVDPSERRRSVAFVFVAGHFQLPQLAVHGQATSTWLQKHTELWDGKAGNAKAVAGVTIEHLGAMEWKDDESSLKYRPTGKQEIELVYTANAALDRIYIEALAQRTKTRTMTLKPIDGVYLGEGQPLFHVGIPTISLIPTPDYLCAAVPNGYIEKLDRQLLYEQIQTFAKVLSALDRTSAEQLLKKERQPLSFLRKVLKFLRLWNYVRKKFSN